MATVERAVLGVRRSSIPEQRVDPHDEILKHIYADAKTKLGYQGPQPTPPKPYLLAEALKKLEIKPLNRAAVKRYKSYMAHRPSPERATVGRLVMVLIAAAISAIHTVATTGQWAWMWVVIPSIIATVVCLCTLTVLDHARWSWESHWLEHYNKIVPEMALANALRIKEALPDVTFQVEELTYHSEPVPRDPFLVAQYGRERYYIDVWDEPKFRP